MKCIIALLKDLFDQYPILLIIKLCVCERYVSQCIYRVLRYEIDSHSDQNKGPDPRTLPWSTDLSHIRTSNIDFCHGRRFFKNITNKEAKKDWFQY